MVGKNGQIIAEPNDPNTVHNFSILSEDKLITALKNIPKKTVTAYSLEKSLIGYNGELQYLRIPSKRGYYLCTDVNGNLIFKEL